MKSQRQNEKSATGIDSRPRFPPRSGLRPLPHGEAPGRRPSASSPGASSSQSRQGGSGSSDGAAPAAPKLSACRLASPDADVGMSSCAATGAPLYPASRRGQVRAARWRGEVKIGDRQNARPARTRGRLRDAARCGKGLFPICVSMPCAFVIAPAEFSTDTDGGRRLRCATWSLPTDVAAMAAAFPNAVRKCEMRGRRRVAAVMAGLCRAAWSEVGRRPVQSRSDGRRP